MSLAKLLFCTLPLLSIAVTFAQTQEPEGQPSLGDVARETREQRRLQPQQESAHAMKVRELIADMSMNTPEDYQEKINELLGRRDFDGLENTAATARSTKARFAGGAWKLLFFYEAVSQPSDGRQASSTEWSPKSQF